MLRHENLTSITFSRHTVGMPPETLRSDTRVVVVMGVSGSGKTLVGTRLAQQLGWPFADADDDHPESNRAKMASGRALDDADRAPWLERLRRRVVAHLTSPTSLVLACSALKAAYRDTLAGGDFRVIFVHLEVSRDVLVDRLASREDHWFEPRLLDSQLADLERPDAGIRVDADAPPGEVIEAISNALASHLPG